MFSRKSANEEARLETQTMAPSGEDLDHQAISGGSQPSVKIQPDETQPHVCTMSVDDLKKSWLKAFLARFLTHALAILCVTYVLTRA